MKKEGGKGEIKLNCKPIASEDHYETRTLLLVPAVTAGASLLGSASSFTLMLCSSLNLLISYPFFVSCSLPFSMSFSSCSLFWLRLGNVSFTVCSAKTPPMSRKHLRFSSTVFSVSMTVLKKCESN